LLIKIVRSEKIRAKKGSAKKRSRNSDASKCMTIYTDKRFIFGAAEKVSKKKGR
jgi:hypothetical protein